MIEQLQPHVSDPNFFQHGEKNGVVPLSCNLWLLMHRTPAKLSTRPYYAGRDPSICIGLAIVRYMHVQLRTTKASERGAHSSEYLNTLCYVFETSVYAQYIRRVQMEDLFPRASSMDLARSIDFEQILPYGSKTACQLAKNNLSCFSSMLDEHGSRYRVVHLTDSLRYAGFQEDAEKELSALVAVGEHFLVRGTYWNLIIDDSNTCIPKLHGLQTSRASEILQSAEFIHECVETLCSFRDRPAAADGCE